LVDLDVLVCKEDLARFGITEDLIIDAEDMGADKTMQLVPYEEIQKEMSAANHLIFI
jgi:hypothetical protein